MPPRDLRLVKQSLIAIGAAGVLLCAFFLVFLGAVIVRDRDTPQFPYALVIAAAGATYFGALSTHVWRGLKQVLDVAAIPQTIRILAQSVIGMLVPVAFSAAFLLWLVFQSVY